MGTNCASLLSELQKIWNEIGEADDERDKLLYQLEQECLEAYRRKVEQASRTRAQLKQAVADAKMQLADICAALGDQPAHTKFRTDREKDSSGSLRDQLQAIKPQLEDMIKKKNVRKSQFAEVLKQINSISSELAGAREKSLNSMVIDETDLTLKRLDDVQKQLCLLQKDKADRLNQIFDQLNVLKGLCLVLGVDFKATVCSVSPTLDESCKVKSISADTMKSLAATICSHRDLKLQRLQKLRDLAITMVELWNLIDTPVEEQQMFQNVIRTIAATEDEITEPNVLSLELINNVEAEVARLREMKISKIEEVVTKKRLILEEICRGAHMVVEGQFGRDPSAKSIESWAMDPSNILEQLEVQISEVTKEAFSRKEILEKVKKWLASCEEESWLEEYNRDKNRYNAGRGAHLMLKRAEKARVVVNKIPALVDALRSKVNAWQKERNAEFLYDGVGLMSMLDRYCELKHLKEQERQRQRDQKKLQGQLLTEQEAIFGSKPSPSKSGYKNSRPTNRKMSLGGALLQSSLVDKSAVSSLSLVKNNPVKRQTPRSHHQNSFNSHSSGNENRSGATGNRHSSKAVSAHQAELLPLRQALSPISSLSSNIISCNLQEKNSKSEDFQLHGTRNVCKTPTKTVLLGNDENRTPKTMPVTVPATPSSVSTAMQTVLTPFTPGVRVRGTDEDVEYSYEEIRAGFLVSRSKGRSLNLV